MDVLFVCRAASCDPIMSWISDLSTHWQTDPVGAIEKSSANSKLAIDVLFSVDPLSECTLSALAKVLLSHSTEAQIKSSKGCVYSF
jgi:hypothetical protein